MGRIDNTVVFELLMRLHGYQRGEDGKYGNGAYKAVGERLHIYKAGERTKFAHGKNVKGKRIPYWLTQGRWHMDAILYLREKYPDKSEREVIREFDVNAENQPFQPNIPDDYGQWTFSSHVYTVILETAKETLMGSEAAKELILDVCREFRIDDRVIGRIEKTETFEDVVLYVVREAMVSGNNRVETAESRVGSEGRKPIRTPVERVVAIGEKEGGAERPEKMDPPWFDPEEPVVMLNGKRLNGVHPGFRPWGTAANGNILTSDCYGSLEFPNGEHREIPYLELFGSWEEGMGEFVEGVNMFCEQIDAASDLKDHITKLPYQAKEKAALIEGKKKGYEEHPAKMWLHHMEKLDLTHDGKQTELKLFLGKGDYIAHRIYREEMPLNLEEQKDFVWTMNGIRGDAEHRLCQKPWANCGGGCWITVKGADSQEYLILSYRNPNKVAEVPDVIGYSSSGAYEYEDGTMAAAMAREIQEELGIPSPEPEALRVISYGVDTERYLIQVSFAWETDYTMAEVNRFRKNRTSTGGEQYVFYAPFEPGFCWELLRTAAFEPGAAYALMRLLQKRFGDSV